MKIIDNHIERFKKVIDSFDREIGKIKTGRANPNILDDIMVDAYGSRTPINQLASVNVPDARSIIIQPWDKNIVKDIEKSILESDLGLSPANEGDKIRLVVPLMTEEGRIDMVKQLRQKEEYAKINIRKIRDEIKEEILLAEKNKEFGEDEKYSLLEELDKKTNEYNIKMEEMTEKKEKEIMTV